MQLAHGGQLLDAMPTQQVPTRSGSRAICVSKLA